MDRLKIASRILAGFAANPAVFGPNGMTGWGLVNCTEGDLAGYSLCLADRLIAAEVTTRELTFTQDA